MMMFILSKDKRIPYTVVIVITVDDLETQESISSLLLIVTKFVLNNRVPQNKG